MVRSWVWDMSGRGWRAGGGDGNRNRGSWIGTLGLDGESDGTARRVVIALHA